MKNFLYSLIALIFVSAFAVNMVNAQVSCPLGYASTTITLVDANGCHWVVDLCYRCDITGVNPSNIIINKIDPQLPLETGCSGIPPSKDDMILLLLEQYYELKCDNIPDCLEKDEKCAQSVWLTLDYPICWQWYNSLSFNSGVWTWNHWIQSCPGQGYCQMEWYVCRDGNGVIVRCPGIAVTYAEHDITCTTVWVSEPTSPPAYIPQNLGIHPYGPCFKYILDCHN